MPEKISVEIFRDTNSPDQITEYGEKSVELVNYFAKNLEISKAGRGLRLGAATASLVMENISWPRFDADLNLIITSRNLISDGQEALGSAQASIVRREGVAVVSTASFSPELTGAHELGHLLHFRDRTNLHDSSHCQIDECLMSSTQKTKWVHRETPQQRARRTLRKPRTQPLLSEAYEIDSNRTFCPSCIDQLAQKSFFLSSLYDGNDLAIQWLER